MKINSRNVSYRPSAHYLPKLLGVGKEGSTFAVNLMPRLMSVATLGRFVGLLFGRPVRKDDDLGQALPMTAPKLWIVYQQNCLSWDPASDRRDPVLHISSMQLVTSSNTPTSTGGRRQEDDGKDSVSVDLGPAVLGRMLSVPS